MEVWTPWTKWCVLQKHEAMASTTAYEHARRGSSKRFCDFHDKVFYPLWKFFWYAEKYPALHSERDCCGMMCVCTLCGSYLLCDERAYSMKCVITVKHFFVPNTVSLQEGNYVCSVLIRN
ncbi:hypothetical protein T01_16249 [Trichinella spiralis]|uniref:Uncharacterized protein n=1 Tax=Trichinella spiralis TaxID=6334 RepID=A0A0V1ATI8_TRISP|nr:hypothetical protein T01_16249 [Trichinella spiralis]